MLERLRIIGLLAAGLASAACQESPLAPTDEMPRENPVRIAVAPEPLYAAASTGVTFTVNGQVREHAFHVGFDLVLRANIANEIGVMLTSDTVTLQQLQSVAPDGPGGGVDRATFRSESRSGEDRIEAGQETSRAFDVWYTLPNGGREALIAVTLNFVDDNGTAFNQVHQVTVQPGPAP